MPRARLGGAAPAVYSSCLLLNLTYAFGSSSRGTSWLTTKPGLALPDMIRVVEIPVAGLYVALAGAQVQALFKELTKTQAAGLIWDLLSGAPGSAGT